DGIFKVVGTDRSIGLLELAAAARDPARRPAGMAPGLDERGRAEVTSFTYPNGCHICEVEIDPETGAIEVDRYLSVNDFGKVINPMVIAGQVQGGIAQGLSQALREHHVIDRATGQPLSASFMDYGLIRADELPAFVLERHEVPCRTNVLGVKGGGEAGTVGALPCFVNAVVDALAPLGIEHIDMPATPERIWRAIRDAGGG
ncbi:MAG: molybdopterin-dependent oxidoreductase, partial [Rhodospirillales bacterium]|nr:molybdopterin-dependent oxidoreductase [Rhodospirillales bacterium]